MKLQSMASVASVCVLQLVGMLTYASPDASAQSDEDVYVVIGTKSR